MLHMMSPCLDFSSQVYYFCHVMFGSQVSNVGDCDISPGCSWHLENSDEKEPRISIQLKSSENPWT